MSTLKVGGPFHYATGEMPQAGDRIYAGDSNGREDFITVVRRVSDGGQYLTTAGWPECSFPVFGCALVKRGNLPNDSDEPQPPAAPASEEQK